MVKWVLRIGIAVGLLILIFRYIPFSEVTSAIASADGVWLLAGVGAFIMERFTIAFRVRMLTDRLTMGHSLWGLFEINAISTFYGTFLPGDLAGGAVRWYKMAKPTGQNAQALAAIVFERLIDTIALVFFGLVFWFLGSPPFETAAVNIMLTLILLGLIIGAFVILNDRASAMVRWALSLLPNAKLRHVIAHKSEKVLSAVREFRGFSFYEAALLFLLTVVRHFFSILILVFFANALAMNIDFITLGWMRSVINVIIMLPLAFAGLGVKEGGFVVLMGPYGIPGSQAVALSLLTFFAHILFSGIGGALELKNMFRKV